jgi:hypothetical protein
VIVMRVCGLPLVSSCATGRRRTSRADPPNLVAHIRTWRACDLGAATVRVTSGNSVDLRACAADARPHRPVVPAGESEAEFALLREARLAVIPSDWVTTPTAGTTAHLLTAVADDQGVEPALSVVVGDCPLPSCVTLVVRRLRTHAGHPKSCDHIS